MATRRTLERRPRLTVGDGFRIGFGISIWLVATTVAMWAVLALCFGALALLGGAV